MEKRILFSILMLSGTLAFTWFTRVYAQDTDENKGEAKVEGRLEKQFNVSDAQIDSLRKQKLGYGEIRKVFSVYSAYGRDIAYNFFAEGIIRPDKLI